MGANVIGNELAQVCHLLARLVDGVESIARHVAADEMDLRRLHNIRHDTLVLMARLG